MRTPDRAIAFVFRSHPLKAAWARWTATLVFPPQADATTVLRIEIVNGEGVKENGSVFEFAGRSLPVKDGVAEIPYADFIAGKHEQELWLRREGHFPVPGGLTFD